MRCRPGVRAAALLALGLAVLVYAGHPEALLGAGTLLALYVVARVVGTGFRRARADGLRRGLTSAAARVGTVGAAVAVAMLASAALALPFIEFVRNGFTYKAGQAGQDISLPSVLLNTILVPNLFSPTYTIPNVLRSSLNVAAPWPRIAHTIVHIPITSCYAGILSPIFGVYGIVRGRLRVGMILCLLLGLGMIVRLPILSLPVRLPGYDFSLGVSWVFLFVFPMTVLGGWGLSVWQRDRAALAGILLPALCVAMVGALGLLYRHWHGAMVASGNRAFVEPQFAFQGALVAAAAVLASISLLAGWRVARGIGRVTLSLGWAPSRRTARAWKRTWTAASASRAARVLAAACIILLAFSDQYVNSQTDAASASPFDFPQTPITQFLERQQTVNPEARIWSYEAGRVQYLFQPQDNVPYHLYDASIETPLYVGRFIDFAGDGYTSNATWRVTQIGDGSLRWLDLMGVAWIVVASDADLYAGSPITFPSLGGSGERAAGTGVQGRRSDRAARRGAFPRAFIVRRTTTEASARVMDAMSTADLRTTAVVEAPLPAGQAAALAAAPISDTSSVSITSYAPQRVQLAANMVHAGLVLLTDTYYPGWVARLDGRCRADCGGGRGVPGGVRAGRLAHAHVHVRAVFVP